MRVRCTVKTYSRLDAVLEVEPECCIGAVDIESLHGYNSRTSFDTLESDYLQFAGLFEREQPVKEPLGQSELVCSNGIKPFFLYPLQASVKSDYSRNVHRARFKSVRHEIRDLFGMAYGARASGKERIDKADHAFVKYESAYALRTEQRLVSGEAKRVYMHFLHVYRYDACALCRVNDELQSVLLTDLADFLQRIERSYQIACVCHDYGDCVVFDHAFDCIQNELPAFSARDPVEFDAFFGELHERSHHSIVFHRRAEDVVARFQQSLEHHVQRLRDILREDHVLAVRTSEHLHEHLTCLKDCAFQIVCHLIAAAVDIGAYARHVFVNSICDFSRFRERSRSVIKIYLFHLQNLTHTG